MIKTTKYNPNPRSNVRTTFPTELL